ncbi:MAG: cadherin repeat domain-containing protein [Eubacterium sp.]|nr:cadherin repeat domain-containing protein [Eubacterium sp.]
MKKTLSIALSLIMIITTLAALPFSAHAASTSIYKVNLSYYFDDRDRINFAPTTSGQNFTVYSVNWEDQNGQPFNNDQIDADSDETYTLTVNLSANTGYDFSDNISVDFNGVRLQEGGASIKENEYTYRTMGYELELTVTFRYLEAELNGTPDFSYSHYIAAYSGFYIKDQELELEPPEYDEKYHFDHWASQGDFTVNYSSYSYTKAYMGSTPATLLAYYTAHNWNDGVVTKAATTTATGVKTYTCGCGATKTESIPKLAKKANPITAKGKTKTVKYATVKKKNVTVARKDAITVSKGKGTITYTKSSGNKKIVIDKKTGKITVKKGLKKGTYKVKVKVKAAGNATYKAKTVTVTVTIKVK